MRRTMIAGAIAVASALASMNATAAGFYEGCRVQSDNQIELKVKSRFDDITSENLTRKLTLKGFKGQTEEKPNGYWWFLSVPYSNVTTNNHESNEGISDVYLGAGLMGRLGDINWISYAAVTLPTGDTGYQRPAKDYSLEGFAKDLAGAGDRKGRLGVLLDYAKRVSTYESLPENRPALGNGRTDVSLGIGATKLFCDGKIGLNGSLDYTITGTDNSGINGPDVLSVGLFCDTAVYKDKRVGLGIDYWHDTTSNDGASLTGGAFIPFKGCKYVVELRVDKGIMNDESTTATATFKYNF